MNLEKLTAYECVQEKKLIELDGKGYLLRHKKTKANIVVIENKDDNKVFTIGFKTPPKDSTGAPHIVEHTVLCGSKRFPAKDPFVELVKGSLNTFLNAMTYPDKTVYPVASCNAKDFQNLMHVYLDAVFYPNIYKERKIFDQEGWHYELDSPENEISYNGVVYNEMKGVFSSPSELLNRLVQKALFPDNAYGVESGGEPEVIPTLTYEDFLAFHKEYYHPSNSYIYLYGDMDMAEKLEWMDAEYLSEFDYQEPTSELKKQKAFLEMAELKEYYSLTEGESTEKKTYFSYNAVVGDSLDEKLYLAFQILDYVLLSAPGAPLKQALIEAGIGDDIISSYENEIMQPVFSVVAKNVEPEQKEKFLEILFNTMKDIVKEGIDERSLRAAINYFEFKYRESDFGQYPKGLMYGLQIFDSWLYDAEKPFIHIEANDTFEFLKEQVGTDYYVKLMETYLIDSNHCAFVSVEPKIGLTAEIERVEAEKLAAYKASLSEEEIAQVICRTEELKRYQEEPTPKEDLEKIPLLALEDIDKKIHPLVCEQEKEVDFTLLKHDVFTNGIAYLRLAFDVTNRKEYAPYLSLLVTMFEYIDTKNYSYRDLANEVDLHTGGIVNSLGVTERASQGDFVLMLDFQAKVLYEKAGKAFELISEMMRNTLFTDEKRFREIVAETRSRYQVRLQSSGHSTAVARCNSYGSEAGFIIDMAKGIGFYDFLLDLEEHFEEKKATTISICEGLLKEIFCTDNFIASITADKEGYELCKKELLKFVPEALIGKKQDIEQPLCETKKQNQNEGFATAGKIQFVARTGNFVKAGLPYTGTLKVVRTILGYDYLWNQIRVKGGAYGAMTGFSYSGNAFFVSYRDPNLEKTNEVYRGVVSYLENFKTDDRDMLKYLIGTISDMDIPLTPRAVGTRAYNAFLSGIDNEDLQKERDEVLSTNVEKVRETAKIVKAVLDCNQLCAIGNEGKLKECSGMFEVIKPLV